MGDFLTITVTSRPQPILSPSLPAALLFNNDIANIIYLGDNLGMSASQLNVGQLQPQGSTSFDLTLPGTPQYIYASCAPGQTAQMLVMPGVTNYGGSPALIAASIAQSGFPILTGEKVVISPASHSIPQGTPLVITVPVTQPSYAISFDCYNSQSSLAAPLVVNLSWQDQVTGIEVDRQIWNILQGANSSNKHKIAGNGPTAGNQLVITFTNNLVTTTLTMGNLTLVETSHTYVLHDWRTVNGSTGFVLTGFDGSSALNVSIGNDAVAGIIGQVVQFTIPANANQKFALPLFSGTINVFALLISTLAQALSSYICNEADSFNTSLGSAICAVPGNGVFVSNNAQQLSGNVILPRSQCSLRIDNNTAGALTAYAGLTAA